MALDTVAEIEEVLRENDGFSFEDWDVLGAIQRQIDLRYAVAPSRSCHGFDATGGAHGCDLGKHAQVAASERLPATAAALRLLRDQIYELAPHFIDFETDWHARSYIGFPRYWSAADIRRSADWTLEVLPAPGVPPGDAGLVGSPGAAYRRFLLALCHWLRRFRYANATPYCSAEKTVSREWTWERTQSGVREQEEGSEDPPDPPDETDEEEMTATQNGAAFGGVYVEHFRWVKFRNLTDKDPRPADIIQDGWYRIDDYESKPFYLDYAQYAPHDLGDYLPYGWKEWDTSWEYLEYGISPAAVRRWMQATFVSWTAQPGWISDPSDPPDVAKFPLMGITGETEFPQGGEPGVVESDFNAFFPEAGHVVSYNLAIQRTARKEDVYHASGTRIVRSARFVREESISLSRSGIPLEVVVRNPAGHPATVGALLYADGTAAEEKRARKDTAVEAGVSRIAGREYRVDSLTAFSVSASVERVRTANRLRPGPDGNPLSYCETDEDEWNYDEAASTAWTRAGETSRRTLDGSRSLVVETRADNESGGFPVFETEREVERIADGFGLLPVGGEESGERAAACHPVRLLDLDAHAYGNLWSHADLPMIDLDPEDAFDALAPNAVYWRSWNGGRLSASSAMRIFAFFDYGAAFTVDDDPSIFDTQNA